MQTMLSTVFHVLTPASVATPGGVCGVCPRRVWWARHAEAGSSVILGEPVLHVTARPCGSDEGSFSTWVCVATIRPVVLSTFRS